MGCSELLSGHIALTGHERQGVKTGPVLTQLAITLAVMEPKRLAYNVASCAAPWCGCVCPAAIRAGDVRPTTHVWECYDDLSHVENRRPCKDYCLKLAWNKCAPCSHCPSQSAAVVRMTKE